MKWIKEKYQQWCKETKRNGSVLVGGSMNEFFDWLIEQPTSAPNLPGKYYVEVPIERYNALRW